MEVPAFRNKILQNAYNAFVVVNTGEPLSRAGELKKVRVLVVLDKKEETTILKEFLRKILSSIKVEMATDSALLTLTPDELLSLIPQSRKAGVENIIIFGLNPKRIGINYVYQQYKVLKISNINLLIADTLEAIQNDKKRKQQLWDGLRDMFSPG